MAGIRRKKRMERFGRITREAAAAFAAGDEVTLHRELRLPPWQVSPLRATGACPWPEGTGGAQSWADSVALREVLRGNG